MNYILCKKKFYFFFLLVIVDLLAVYCTRKNEGEYSVTQEKLYYKLLGIGDGQKHPSDGNYLQLEVVYKTQKDSVFWDSKNNSFYGYFYQFVNKRKTGNYLDYLLQMVEGDSAAFMVKKDVFFKEVFGSDAPVFISKDSMVKVNLKLLKILKETDYTNFLKRQEEREAEAKEFELLQISKCLKTKFKSPIALDNDYFFEYIKRGAGELIDSGKKVVLEYKGFFMDGRLADFSPEGMPFELYFGEKEQLLPGLQRGITSFRKGDIAKFILPSHLAFGEQGSSSGNIPPFTPLFYEVKIIDVQ